MSTCRWILNIWNGLSIDRIHAHSLASLLARQLVRGIFACLQPNVRFEALEVHSLGPLVDVIVNTSDRSYVQQAAKSATNNEKSLVAMVRSSIVHPQMAYCTHPFQFSGLSSWMC